MTVNVVAADAASIGLILLELLTNALKYGQGQVTVTLAPRPGTILLRVEDEGTLLPPDFDPAASKGLGMRVLLGLLKGQRGRLEIDHTRGHTCFDVLLRAPLATPQPQG